MSLLTLLKPTHLRQINLEENFKNSRKKLKIKLCIYNSSKEFYRESKGHLRIRINLNSNFLRKSKS